VSPRPTADAVLVAGLGRFGTAVARTLTALGTDVLAIDAEPRRVQELSEVVARAAELDTTDPDALRQVGAADLARAVVGIGDDMEASILTVAALADLGVPEIWAKAVSAAHARILERIGAHHVVRPEHDMGERVANIVRGRLIDYVEIDEDFVLAETAAPPEARGHTLREAGLRTRYDVTVVGVKHPAGSYSYATPDTLVDAGDALLVAGHPRAVRCFTEAV
jgi:trk system potassium uptake protein TrkA